MENNSRANLVKTATVVLAGVGLVLTIARVAEVFSGFGIWDVTSTTGYLVVFAILAWFACVGDHIPVKAFGGALALRALFSLGTSAMSLMQGAPAVFLFLNGLSVLSIVVALVFISERSAVCEAGLIVNFIVCIVRLLYVSANNPVGFQYFRLVLPVLDLALPIAYWFMVKAKAKK